MTKIEIKAMQGELDAAHARIAELERCCDDANAHAAWAEADGKKWKDRFRWLVQSTCKSVVCGKFPHCTQECAMNNVWPEKEQRIAEYADEEMGR